MTRESVVDLVPKALYDLYRAAGTGDDKVAHDEQKQRRARDVAIRFAQKCKARVQRNAGGAESPHSLETNRALAADILNHRAIRQAISMMQDADWVSMETAAFAHGMSKLTLERRLEAHLQPPLTPEEEARGVLARPAWRLQLADLGHARRKEHKRP